MRKEKNSFLKALSNESYEIVPLYCTGFHEIGFITNYLATYSLDYDNKNDLILFGKNYNIIRSMGFDAVSLWDFRRSKGGYMLNDDLKVDPWGRIFRNRWYQNEGVLKNETTLNNWTHLKPPSEVKMKNLKKFLEASKSSLVPVLSLPGLFEKSWQCMGFVQFAKSLKQELSFLRRVIKFFFDYTIELLDLLQKTGARVFLIADDIGYKHRAFIPKTLWESYFFKKYCDIVNFIHKKRGKVIFHSDGYICDYMDTIISLNFDAVQSLEPKAGVNIFKLFKQYQDQICFIGNLDISDLIFKTPRYITNYVYKLMKNAKISKSRLVVSPTQQINKKVKPSTVKAMIKTVKRKKM
ncbi:MAG: hypothetical protein GF383_06555 [Candidatus Lokiarchaeota archaeon]|nr:hypothetical protein [Candidatus Lokiarchaeota archaeon]